MYGDFTSFKSAVTAKAWTRASPSSIRRVSGPAVVSGWGRKGVRDLGKPVAHDPLVRADLPTGTVTFLFTDIEGSTLLLEELGTEGYAAVLAEHRRLCREAWVAHGGVEVDTEGDAFFVVFATAPGALRAAEAAQRKLERGPVRVRMGMHTGTPLLTETGYVGMDVHRAARIAAAVHGGQVVLSASTTSLVGDAGLVDLGEHRFKDLSAPERVFQLGVGEFPPLKSLYRTNLPVPATPFLGRSRELGEVVGLLSREDVRLLTLTGPGGTGKTRLALQAAAEVSDDYPDGVFWVPLASLRNPQLVLSAMAQVVEVKEEPGRELADTLAGWLAGKRLLLLLDNAEHLLPGIASVLAALREPASTVQLLVTSRERLQLQMESLYEVPSLAPDEAVELFVARAAALGTLVERSPVLEELCRRLDELPLALELAAVRTRLFSVEQLVERLSSRLDLFKGARDSDPRQQTLRATIDWSYELLDPEEQRLLRALSVFVGGCTYEAAEQVAGSEPDTLQSLIDKSLVRRRETSVGQRYWMLTSIGDFAHEKLDGLGEREKLLERLLGWLAQLSDEHASAVRMHDSLAQEVLLEEQPNILAALEWAIAVGRVEAAQRLMLGSWFLWISSGFASEGDLWAQRVADLPSEPTVLYAESLSTAGVFPRFRGEPERALALQRRGLELLERVSPDSPFRAAGYTDTAGVLRMLGRLDEAEAYADRGLELRREAGQPGGIAHALAAVASVEQARGALEQALSTLGEAVDLLDGEGEFGRFEAAAAIAEIGAIERSLGRYEASRASLREAFKRVSRSEKVVYLAEIVGEFGLLRLVQKQIDEAAPLLSWSIRTLREAGLEHSRRDELEAGLAQARELLGDEPFAAVEAFTARLTPDDLDNLLNRAD